MAETARKPRSFFRSSGFSILNAARPSSVSASPAQPIARETVLAALADPDSAPAPVIRRGRPRKSTSIAVQEPDNASGAADRQSLHLAESSGSASAGGNLPMEPAPVNVGKTVAAGRVKLRRAARVAVKNPEATEWETDEASSSASPDKTSHKSSRPLATTTQDAIPLPSTPIRRTKKLGKRREITDAQSSNEKLSLVLQRAMRATITGNPAPRARTSSSWTIAESGAGKKRSGVRSIKSAIARGARQVKGRAEGQGRGKKLVAQKAGKVDSVLAKKGGRGGNSKSVRISKNITKVDDNEAGAEREVVGVPEVELDLPQPGLIKTPPGQKKEFMNAGFYCQNPDAKSPFKLVSKVLKQREADAMALKSNKGPGKGKGQGKTKAVPLLPAKAKPGPPPPTTPSKLAERHFFPPLPYYHGLKHFFDEEHEFVLPFNITWEAENGLLLSSKKPQPFQKIRANMFVERTRRIAEHRAICHCDPESGCGDNCINRMLQQFCGKDCATGAACTNQSLVRRQTPPTRVFYTGSRGFGLKAMEDIPAGTFVIDYRGEIINLATFVSRLTDEYKGSRNFYALAYDGDEVIDAGRKGNEARFINHGCDPNLEVHKYQLVGDGYEEYEVGLWTSRDVKAGEELFYNYNFDSFAASADTELRTPCNCGATNCVGFLGRKAGERSAKEIAADLADQATIKAKKAAARAQRAQKIVAKSTGKKGGVRSRMPLKAAKLIADKNPGKPVRTSRKPKRPKEMVAASEPTTAVTAEIQTPATLNQDDQLGASMDDIERTAESATVVGTDPANVTEPLVTAAFKASSAGERAVEGTLDVEPVHAPKGRGKRASASLLAAPQSKRRPKKAATSGSSFDRPAEISGPAPATLIPAVVAAPETPARAIPSGLSAQIITSPALPLKSPFTTQPLQLGRPTSSEAFQPLSTEGDSPRATAGALSVPSLSSKSPGPSVPGQSSSGPMTPGSDNADLKRKSGWANWLKKHAGERARTLEDWHDLRIERRRGVGWMNMMIQEYGLLDSPAPQDGYTPAGSPSSFRNTIEALGKGPLAEPKIRLGGPSLKKSKGPRRKRAIAAEVEEDGQDTAAGMPTSALSPTSRSTSGLAASSEPVGTDELPRVARKKGRGQSRHSDTVLLGVKHPAKISAAPPLAAGSGGNVTRFWKPAGEPALSGSVAFAAEEHSSLRDSLTKLPAGPSSAQRRAKAPKLPKLTPRFSPPPAEPSVVDPSTSATDPAERLEAGPTMQPSAPQQSLAQADAASLAVPPAHETVPAQTTPAADTAVPLAPGEGIVSNNVTGEQTKTPTNKRKEIAARNGAPRGYAYIWELIQAPAPLVPVAQEDEGRGKRPRRSVASVA